VAELCAGCGKTEVRALGMLCGPCGNEGPKKRDRLVGHAVRARKSARLQAAKPGGQPRSAFLLYCINTHYWRLDVDPDVQPSEAQFICPDCGGESMVVKRIQISITDAACTAVCWNAEDPYRCSCSCGGTNHGRRGAPEAEPPDLVAV